MSLRVAQPEYGGAFQTDPETALPCRFVLPGELIELATQSPALIIEPSPDRVTPRCPHFGACGGCDYQHAAPDAQLTLKQTILHQTFEATGLRDLPAIQTHAAPPWEYRNRIRVRIERTEGVFRIGYNRRGTRDFLPIRECPISAPLLLRAAFTLVEAAATEPVVASWLPSIAEAEFQANTYVVQLTLFTREKRSNGFTRLCEALQRRLPELAGAGCLPANAGYGARERAQWGAGGLAYRVLDHTYWVSRGGFFQVNRFLVSQMIELVTARRSGALAWDLFAGVGLFSRALVASFEQVVAVESSEIAAADLAASAKPLKRGSLRAVHAEAAEFLRGAVLQRERPDLIVMDPPRAGVGPEVCGFLARIAAPALVYVSCDPTTLARDLAILVHSGYCLTAVHLLDMFPQTFHVETIVFLQK